MKTKPRVFVSVPDDRHLDARRKKLKQAVTGFIEKRGFELEAFEPEQLGGRRKFNRDQWTVDEADARIRACDAVLVLALARHVHILQSTRDGFGGDHRGIPLKLATPYNHLEGALGLAQRLPLLLVCEEGMDRTGIFDSGVKTVAIPDNAAGEWVKSRSFRDHFASWAAAVRTRRDVFLGYCSKANKVAEEIRGYLERAGFSVLDWSRDFRPAGTNILKEIERASAQCRCAVFFFTKDDELDENARGKASFKAVPRDNVLLEAGYFMQARGEARVAIVREKDAKMPADLGGIIYLSFEKRSDLSAVKKRLVNFLLGAL